MLARIAHELYWLGRNLARAEFTARAVEAVFQAELQGTSETTPGVSFGSGGLLAMLGDVSVQDDGPRNGRALGGHALGQLTLDPERPGSMLASIERAREGARTVRDVISAEMWEAINTTALGLRGGGQPGWGGAAQPLDAARRGQVLPRRRRADRDLGHGAEDAARGDADRRGGPGRRYGAD